MSGNLAPDVSLAAVNATIARLNNKIQYLGTMVNQMFETRLDIERVSNRVNDDEPGVEGHMEDIREEIAERRRIHRPRELYGLLPPGWRRSGEFKLLEGPTPAIVPPFIPTSPIFYVVTKGRVPGIYSDGDWVKHLQGGLDHYKKGCIETEDLWEAFELWDDALHTLQVIGRTPGDEEKYGPNGFHVPTYSASQRENRALRLAAMLTVGAQIRLAEFGISQSKFGQPNLGSSA
ncbi:hypothetical protein DFP72DRAFT_851849 [Ephemerocybe angulata]|uniref:Uncharacterized protein n=1 Tax=Ephemerocybe angulata TaxID=980116 RepID=A0A8H6M2T1_9AGAR|nr:hypothetical protein DFP72DRAFT_851849 [Tulosesus angulatus]